MRFSRHSLCLSFVFVCLSSLVLGVGLSAPQARWLGFTTAAQSSPLKQAVWQKPDSSATLTPQPLAEPKPANPDSQLVAAPTQQTVELRLDDGGVDDALQADGWLVLNRVTPPAYPATLQKLRILFAALSNQPSPVGKPITLVVYADPTGSGQLPAKPTLVRSNATVPGVSLTNFFDFTLADAVTIASGDFYIGYQLATPTQGVGLFFDTNNVSAAAQNRTFISTDNGASFTALPSPTGSSSAIALVRGVVSLPNAPNGPTIDVSPSLNFGTVSVNGTADRTLTIRNIGSSALSVSNITSTNPAFMVLPPSPPLSIAAGGLQQISVRFNTAVQGVQNGTLTIESSDLLRPSLNVSLAASAVVVTNTVVPLTSGTPQSGSSGSSTSSCTLSSTQYSIVVPAGGSSLQITLSGNQDVDLYVRYNSAVALTNNQIVADFRSQSLSSTESLTITPATIPALQPGTYYIGVGNCSSFTANYTVTATVTIGTAGQVTEELNVDDGSGETGLAGNGAYFVNRLTPSRYPSRIQRVRIYIAPLTNLPDPSGAQLRLIIFNTPRNNEPPASPSYLLDRTVTIPTITSARYVDFEVPEAPSISEGDWFVGFQMPNPSGGVACVFDGTSTAQGRSYFKTLTGTSYQNATGLNAMIRGVALSGTPLVCNYALAPTNQTFTASGGTGTVNVTVNSGCAWQATSNANWLTINSGAAGNGNGTVNFTATANSTVTERTGTLTIAGQTFPVTQAGVPCTYSINPTSQNFTASGGSGNVAVTTTNGCAWTVTSNAAWLTITAGVAGNGNGNVAFNVDANPNQTQRTGTLTIAGQTFTVTQAALVCSYTIAPTNQSVAANGGTGSVNVTVANGCAWTATSGADWLTITSGASGNGNGAVNFTATANPTGAQRSGTLTIAGQSFTVTQAGQTCSYSITPTSQSFAVGGGTGTVNVTALTGCNWTATSNATWLTITSGAAGNGNGSVGFSVAANTAATPRTGTLTVAGQAFTVTQAEQCAYVIAPTSQSFETAGGTGSANVTTTSACAWTATSNANWLTITAGASGNGNGTVNYSVAANPNTSARTGTLTIAGQTFTVTQAALVCTYAISPLSQTVAATASTGSVNVSVNSGCAWTATSNAAWLTITSSAAGGGNGTVNFSAVANPSVNARTGTLTIAGLTFTVTQTGAVTTRTVRVAPVIGAAGAKVRVPLELVALGDENAVAFSLNFDPAVLSNPQAELPLPGGPAVFSNTSQVTQGRLGLTLSLNSGQRFEAGTRLLAAVAFDIAANATGQTSLSFGDQPVERKVTDTSATLLPANHTGGAVTIANPFASVSAASFTAAALAPGSMIAGFGAKLATRTEVAATQPLPTTLAGTTVSVRDSAGATRLAQLFFVATAQVNYLLPLETAPGTATLTVTSGDGAISLGTITVASVASGLFTANANGQGVAAGFALRVKADGSQTLEPLAVLNSAQQYVPNPIDVSVANEQVFLILFGTGFRNVTRLSDVTVQIGGLNATPQFAGAQGDLAGLDQLNVPLSRDLSGRGQLDVVLTAAGRSANVVKIAVK